MSCSAIRALRAGLLFLPLSLSALSAQTLIDAVAIDTPLPLDPAPDCEALAIGEFVDGLPNRSAVVLRGGRLLQAYRPDVLTAVWDLGVSGVRAVASLLTPPGATDRLAFLDNNGLQLRTQAGGVLSPAGIGTLASFSNYHALSVRTEVVSGVPTAYVLAAGKVDPADPAAANKLRVAVLTTAADFYDTVSMNVEWSFSAPLLAALATNWLPGGLPEVAVATTSQLIVKSGLGTTLATFSQAMAQCSLCVQPTPSGPERLAVVYRDAGQLWSRSLLGMSVSAAVGVPNSAGAHLYGATCGDMNDDGFGDLVICTNKVRVHTMYGGNGPFSGGASVSYLSLGVGGPHGPGQLIDLNRDGTTDLVLACDVVVNGVQQDHIATLPDMMLQLAGEEPALPEYLPVPVADVDSIEFDLPAGDVLSVTLDFGAAGDWVHVALWEYPDGATELDATPTFYLCQIPTGPGSIDIEFPHQPDPDNLNTWSNKMRFHVEVTPIDVVLAQGSTTTVEAWWATGESRPFGFTAMHKLERPEGLIEEFDHDAMTRYHNEDPAFSLIGSWSVSIPGKAAEYHDPVKERSTRHNGVLVPAPRRGPDPAGPVEVE